MSDTPPQANATELPLPPAVAGTSLDGGLYTISEAENRAVCESTGATPAHDGTAHPIFFYIGTQVGMKLTVDQLCAVCAFNVEDGPVMGGCKAAFQRPLQVGQAYRVTGRIDGLVRKTSRKLGIMDVLDYTLELRLPDGSLACSTTNTWMLPRRMVR